LLVASTHKSCPDAADGRLLLSLIIDSGQGVHRRIPNTKRRKATSLLSVYWQMRNGCNVSRDLWRRSRPPGGRKPPHRKPEMTQVRSSREAPAQEWPHGPRGFSPRGRRALTDAGLTNDAFRGKNSS